MKSSVPEVRDMPKTLNGFERQLCDIQGRLFERSDVVMAIEDLKEIHRQENS